MSVMLLDVWRAARARSVPFSGESAGYVALGLCEELGRGPRAIGLQAVELCDDGALRVVTGEPCSAEQAEEAVRSVLGLLLGVASSPGPALHRAASRDSGAGVDALSTELKRALIPVNRAAARRALLRLCRETARAVAAGQLAAEPSADGLDMSPVAPPSAKASPALPSPVPARVVTPPPLPVSVEPPAVVAPVAVVVPLVGVSSVPAPVVVAAPGAKAVANLELELGAFPLEPEQVTSAETVVARIRQRVRPLPPPLPRSDRHASTPRIGSMEAASEAPTPVMRTPSPPPLPLFSDATERAPSVRQFFAEPFDLCASAIDAVPVVEIVERPAPELTLTPPEPIEVAPVVTALPAVEALPPVVESPRLAELEPPLADPEAEERAIAVALAIAEPPEPAELNESPALIVGVHVADSDDVAELVDDDDLETRPLLGRLPPVPYAGLPAKASDVAELARGFQVGGAVDEAELRRELKALAGVDLTPAQPLAAGTR